MLFLFGIFVNHDEKIYEYGINVPGDFLKHAFHQLTTMKPESIGSKDPSRSINMESPRM